MGADGMIEWDRVYQPYPDHYVAAQGRKFDPVPKPIPWVGSPKDTERLTAEWLLRDSRTDEIRLCEEPILNLVKDHWYRAEFEEGRFVHLCFPEKLISFRRQYESLYMQSAMLPTDNATGIQMLYELQGAARERLWAAWNTMGGDGMYVEPDLKPYGDHLDAFSAALLAHEDRRPVWHKKCFRCQEPLPKGLQLWVAIQHGKLGKL